MQRAIALILLWSSILHSSQSQIQLPRLISDGVILQHDEPLNIWGWASPGESVTLKLGGYEYVAQAEDNGDWSVTVPPQEAGGPHELVFTGTNEIIVKDVLFGDVWICSGQSNMELTMERVKEKYPDVISSASNRYIRQFTVPDQYDFKHAHSDFDEGSWEEVDSQSILSFSAVAYFFARELYDKYDVPVGLINAAVGGSPVEAWMSEDALKQFPDAYDEMQKYKDDKLIESIESADRKRIGLWHNELNRLDKGLSSSARWYEPYYEDVEWDVMEIPGFWSDHSTDHLNGVFWFRKTFYLPPDLAGRPGRLWLGRIVDQDFAYINGQLTGTTGYQYPPRRYIVKPGILKEGENTLAVRVINNQGKGGFIPDKPYFLEVGPDTFDLKGIWKYNIGTLMDPLESQTFIRWKPGGLYNRMIAPLVNYQTKGVIWYQGESNTDEPDLYQGRFSAMIADWRKKWGRELPFLYVQLANFMESHPSPSQSNWAELRQAQLNTLEVSRTGMAVAIDLGEWNDIHPLNKEDVGRRLAWQAMKVAYGEMRGAKESPIPLSADFQRRKVVITFKNMGAGLVARSGPLAHFAISNDGVHFEWASAEIKGDTITVWNKKIKKPIIVRYAWADNPASANLYGKNGLPVSPFEIRK